jgi:hypothetical protein
MNFQRNVVVGSNPDTLMNFQLNKKDKKRKTFYF